MLSSRIYHGLVAGDVVVKEGTIWMEQGYPLINWKEMGLLNPRRKNFQETSVQVC